MVYPKFKLLEILSLHTPRDDVGVKMAYRSSGLGDRVRGVIAYFNYTDVAYVLKDLAAP